MPSKGHVSSAKNNSIMFRKLLIYKMPLNTAPFVKVLQYNEHRTENELWQSILTANATWRNVICLLWRTTMQSCCSLQSWANTKLLCHIKKKHLCFQSFLEKKGWAVYCTCIPLTRIQLEKGFSRLNQCRNAPHQIFNAKPISSICKKGTTSALGDC